MVFGVSEVLASYAIFYDFFFQIKEEHLSDIEYASNCKCKSEADFRYRKRAKTHTVINLSTF